MSCRRPLHGPSHSSRRVTIRQVIDAGLLVPGERLVWDRPRKGERWFATVTENGRLRLDDGSEYPTPTAAARAAAGGRRGGGLDVWKRTRNGQKLSDIWKQVPSAGAVGYGGRHIIGGSPP